MLLVPVPACLLFPLRQLTLELHLHAAAGVQVNAQLLHLEVAGLHAQSRRYIVAVAREGQWLASWVGANERACVWARVCASQVVVVVVRAVGGSCHANVDTVDAKWMLGAAEGLVGELATA